MKKLMIAAVAATMTSVSMADISIKGDAYFSYANNSIGMANGANGNQDSQRVRLHVTGKSGATKVVAVIRNDGNTRVENGSTGSTNTKGALQMDQLYVTTKAGPVNIKAGDYWGTIGLGARSKGAAKKNAISVSSKVGPIKLGLFTHNGGAASGSGSTNVSVSGKVAGATVKVVHNPHNFTDFSVKGTFSGISVGFEHFKDGVKEVSVADATPANPAYTKNNTTLIHIGGKVSGINLDIASIKNDTASAKNAMATGKLTPLGSMLIGTAARGGTATAAANVSNFTKILGVSASAKLAGNTVKAIFTKNTLGAEDKVTGAELIVTRPIAGANLTVNLAKLSGAEITSLNGTNKGIRLDVKF